MIDHPTGSNELILRIETGGGLPGPGLPLNQIPQISVYGDGRIFTNGPVIAIFPGPALPNIQVKQVSGEGLQLILEAARDADLLVGGAHLDLQGIFDAPTTTFTVAADGRAHVVSAYALGLEQGLERGIPADQLDWRRRLIAFSAQMSDLFWLGSAIITDDAPYAFDALRIVTALEDGPRQSGVPRGILAWPLDRPLAVFGESYSGFDGARCGTVRGAELEMLLPDIQGSNAETRWRSENQLYRLFVRPLLPDEEGCPTS